MMSAGCTRVRPHLGAFVDGELPGAARLSISRHLAQCATCALEVDRVRSVGDALRDAAGRLPAGVLDGLAAGVVSRTRAENAQSWPAMFHRAFDDWHWILAVTGSVVAAFVSAMLVSVILRFGPAPERSDSLAALLNNLGSPAGTLFVVATPEGQDADSRLMQFGNAGGAMKRGITDVALPAEFRSPSESQLVGALGSLVAHDVRVMDIRSMSSEERQEIETLLSEISRLRGADTRWSPARLSVLQLRLYANPIAVEAKAL